MFEENSQCNLLKNKYLFKMIKYFVKTVILIMNLYLFSSKKSNKLNRNINIQNISFYLNSTAITNNRLFYNA